MVVEDHPYATAITPSLNNEGGPESSASKTDPIKGDEGDNCDEQDRTKDVETGDDDEGGDEGDDEDNDEDDDLDEYDDFFEEDGDDYVFEQLTSRNCKSTVPGPSNKLNPKSPWRNYTSNNQNYRTLLRSSNHHNKHIVNNMHNPRNSHITNNRAAIERERNLSVHSDYTDINQTQHNQSSNAETIKDTLAEELRKKLGDRESKVVSYVRLLAITILIATTMIIAWGSYAFISTDQKDDFESVFEASAMQIVQSFHESISLQLASLDDFSTYITSYAQASSKSSQNDTFPYVTINDFHVRGANFRVLSKGLLLQWLPLVEDQTRLQWESYANQTYHHQIEDYGTEQSLIQQQDRIFGQVSKEDTNASNDTDDDNKNDTNKSFRFLRSKQHRVLLPFSPSISDGNGQPLPYGTGPYFPMWQTSPIVPIPSLLTTNALSYEPFQDGLKRILETNEAYIGDTFQQSSEIQAVLMENGQYRHDQEELSANISSPIFYPVFDSYDLENRKLVGALIATIDWRVYLKDIILPTVRGVTCVLTSSSNQTYTYVINGNEVDFIGHGDHHNTHFDSWAVDADVSEYFANDFSPKTRAYTAVNLQTSNVGDRHTITIYPSAKMEDTFLTSQPIVYAVVVIVMFLISCSVLVAYDVLVERRQRVVLDAAVQSSAVVHSLFPDNVHSRMFNRDDSSNLKEARPLWNKTRSRRKNAENEERRRRRRRSKRLSSKQPVELYLKEKQEEGHPDATTSTDRNDESNVQGKSRPIADQFLHTTVLFADLAGFTKWCSSRNPEQVFILLETLYQAFDKLAVRRKVFKVETIGDCYMAVTGLPKPQSDHAILMARFARDCIVKMKALTEELASSLGPDTRNLALRVGLNSGPVTAGVLRGDKSRFQLFGDTVNTAARMESTGLNDRIHCSESTAEEINLAGKGYWVIARKDSVVAKGKGEMQTYLLDRLWTLKTQPQNASVSRFSDTADSICDSVDFSITGSGLSSLASSGEEDNGKEARTVAYIINKNGHYETKDKNENSGDEDEQSIPGSFSFQKRASLQHTDNDIDDSNINPISSTAKTCMDNNNHENAGEENNSKQTTLLESIQPIRSQRLLRTHSGELDQRHLTPNVTIALRSQRISRTMSVGGAARPPRPRRGRRQLRAQSLPHLNEH